MPRTRNIITLAATLALPLAAIAGPLAPPAGPVAPTGRTLTEVEPRTPINALTCPGNSDADFVISQPGHYFLPGPITATKAAAITVTASDVTIDLGGFAIRGGPGVAYGVVIPDNGQNYHGVTVRGGSVLGSFQEAGVSLGQGRFSTIEDVTFRGSAYSGLTVGADGMVRRCIVSGPQFGIWGSQSAEIVDCMVASCTNTGIMAVSSIVRNCRVRGCGSRGISAQDGAVIQGNILRSNATGSGQGIYILGSGSKIEGNDVGGSWWAIMLHQSAADNLVVRNTVRKGGGTAIVMNQQVANSFPNNHVARIIADPASPFTNTDPTANIEY